MRLTGRLVASIILATGIFFLVPAPRGCAQEVLFSDDFDDNTKDYGAWTEIYADGTWEEINQRAEFQVYESGFCGAPHNREGIESTPFSVSLSPDRSIVVYWWLVTDIGSTGHVGRPIMEITDGTNWIRVYYYEWVHETRVQDSNGTFVVLNPEKAPGAWGNTLEVFSDRYRAVMDTDDSGWIYEPVFDPDATLRIRLYVKVGGCNSSLYTRSAFDDLYVQTNASENIPPVADAGGPYMIASPGGEVQYDGTDSYDPDGQIVSYEWDIGNTGFWLNEGPTPTISFFSYPGSYDVSLRVTDDHGATDIDHSELHILDIDDGLFGYWNFEQIDGNVLPDISGNGNDGLISGNPSQSIGVVGLGMEFDGENDFIEIDGSSFLSGPCTFCAWVRPKSIVSSKLHCVLKNTNSRIYMGLMPYISNLTLYNNWHFSVGGYEAPLTLPAESLAENPYWTFLCGTWDGSSDEGGVKLYINSVFASQGKRGPSGIIGGTIYIGGQPIFGELFMGYIDELRIYSRVLDEEEIEYLYKYPDNNAPPIAAIDSIKPYAVRQGEEITFKAESSYDADGSITRYDWYSDRDGYLGYSENSTFRTNSLSAGKHIITLFVEDNQNRWSAPEHGRCVVVDGTLYRPPFDSCYTITSVTWPPAYSFADCNRLTGMVGVYGDASLWGDFISQAIQMVITPITETKTIQVNTELFSTGGKEALGPLSLARSSWSLLHYKRNGDQWEFIPPPYGDNIQPYIDWDWVSSTCNWILFSLIDLPAPYMYVWESIQALADFQSSIGGAEEIMASIGACDFDRIGISRSYLVEPGEHAFLLLLNADGGAGPLGQIFIGREGIVPYFEIKDSEEGPLEELTITGLCPIDIFLTDPAGQVITKDSTNVGDIRYLEEDFNLDGERDDIIYIPNCLNGIYSILVQPDTSYIGQSQTYSLYVTYEGKNYLIAENMPISDIPGEPYLFQTGTPSIEATVDVDPDALNLESHGRWVTGYVALPPEYDVNDIDLATVFLNRTVPADPYHAEIEDENDDGIPELEVKFDRQSVQAILTPGDSVEVTISGLVLDEMFAGTDTIRVFSPGDDDCEDEHHEDCDEDHHDDDDDDHDGGDHDHDDDGDGDD